MLKTPHSKTHQNTYRLKSKQPFDVMKVKSHLRNIMELNFKDLEYSDQGMKDLSMQLSDEIRTAVKSENFDRYRIVVTVIIGEKKMQGVHIKHTFLWDRVKDRFVDHVYDTTNFYAQAVVYGIYYD